MPGVNFQPKTDRELLIIVAEQGNVTQEDVKEIKKQLITLNGTVRKHDRIIAKLEGSLYGSLNGSFLPCSKAKQAGILTGLFFIVSLIACATQAFGRAMGWW